MSQNPRSEVYSSKQGVAVTPSDTADLGAPCRALFVGTGGDVAVMGLSTGAASVTYKNVPSGSILPIQVSRVLETDTTASDIIALY